MIDNQLRDRLNGIADQVDAPDIDGAGLVGRVRRRRRMRSAKKGVPVLACAAVAVAGISWQPWSRGRTEAETVQASASGNVPKSAATGTRSPGFACGDQVGAGAATGNRQGSVRAEISGVHRTADGAPQITYTVRSTRTVNLVRDPGMPRVLVVHDGRIVAGQDLTAQELATSSPRVNSDKVARTVTIDPAHPYVATPPPVVGSPCSGRSWGELWAKGGGYEIVVVLNARALTDVAVDPVPDAGRVLVFRAPLTSTTP